MLSTIHAERDQSNANYLREHVYNDAAFALLRLCVNLSKRECALVQQSFKYRRDKSGRRRRTKMNKDSVALAPELFSLLGIAKIEDEAMEKTGLELGESNNRRCAYVAGAYGVDQVIFNSIEATRIGRTGCMGTRGNKADPHIINVTGDGAGLTAASSGVRLSIYPGYN